MNSLCLWEMVNLMEPGCPGEANKPGPTWATPATAPNRPGPSRSSPRFFPRLRSQRAVRVLTALTRRQVQRGCSGKALVLWPDRAGRAPMPPSQRWWTEWGNKSDALVPFHLQIFSRHPACSPFFPPSRSEHWVKRPDTRLSERPQSPHRSRLSRRGGVPGHGMKPGDVGTIPRLRPPRGARQ